MGLFNAVTGTRIPTRTMAVIAIALLLALMCVHVSMPLEGDQALYFFGARQMSEGLVLYRDYWDIKGVGVYGFYWLAGTLFGYSAIGLHVLELLWFSLTALLAYRLCAIATENSRLACLGPLATVGAFFVAATPWHLTQPDGLVTFPLTLAAWAIAEPALQRWNGPLLSWILAGIGAGLATLFVTASILVAFAFVLAAVLFSSRSSATESKAGVLVRLGGFLLGMALVLVIPIALFAKAGALREYLWTTWLYPLAAQTEFSRDVRQLAGSVTWFVGAVCVLIPCALIGGLATLRDLTARGSRSLVGLLMCVWLAAGFVALLVQYHYSWQFHFNHFFVPVGVLAIIGMPEIFRALGSREGRLAALAILIVALVLPVLLVKKIIVQSAQSYAVTPYEDSVKQGLGMAASDDSVYVLGDPRVMFAAGHPQPVKENGWVLEVLLSHQWKEFSAALRQSSPAYLHVMRGYPELLARNAPELWEWICREYEPVHTDSAQATWFRRRNLSP
jgi:hypothetical protein